MRRAAAGAAALALLCGCPAPRTAVRPPPSALPIEVRDGERPVRGVVHVVKRGETLWRIARTYGITPGDLMETNGLSDPRAVPTGTELFVPGATRVLEVPPAPPASAATGTGAGAAGEPPDPDPQPEPEPEPVRTAPPPARATSPVPPIRQAPAPVPAPPARATRPEPEGAPRPAGSGRLGWPLKGDLVARFGVRDGERHDGVDLAAPAGTPVSAAADGVVLWVGAQAGYGQLVILRHAGGLLTLYAHVSEISVKDGDRVRRGEPIARVGRGEGTGAPQVHFEVREGTRPRNPLLYLP